MPRDPPVPAGGRPEVRDGDPCHRRRLSATPPAASWARATRRGSALSRFYRPARGGFALIWSRRRRRGSSRRRIASTFARLTRSSGSTDPMKLQRWRKWYPRTCDLTTRRSNQPKQYRISQLRCRRTEARKMTARRVENWWEGTCADRSKSSRPDLMKQQLFRASG
jgi:hypothetical protein